VSDFICRSCFMAKVSRPMWIRDSVRIWLDWPKRTFYMLHLEGSCGTWIVSVLTDDSCAYSILWMITLHFFAIRFRVHTWVHWIVRGSDCLGFFLFIPLMYWIVVSSVSDCFCGLLGRVHAPSLVLPGSSLIYFLFDLKKKRWGGIHFPWF